MANIISKFISKAKTLGLSQALSLAWGKVTGLKKYREEIDALYYYLNHFVDITKVAPATGALRKMQLCDAVLLSIFDAVCEKQGWQYWLSSGTLLGAKRHGGFIPWDDDQDICMLRKDYDEAARRLPEIFASYGEDSVTAPLLKDGRIGLNYQHGKTGIWCDIFPCDVISVDVDDKAAMKALKKRVIKYHRFYQRKGKNLSQQELAAVREKLVINTNEGGVVLFYPEFDAKCFTCNSNIIFPLTTIQYEGYTLKAPNNTHEYLTRLYGDYMQFPRDGLEHHDAGRGALSGWAARNNIDMDEVLAHLKDIEAFFRA